MYHPLFLFMTRYFSTKEQSTETFLLLLLLLSYICFKSGKQAHPIPKKNSPGGGGPERIPLRPLPQTEKNQYQTIHLILSPKICTSRQNKQLILPPSLTPSTPPPPITPVSAEAISRLQTNPPLPSSRSQNPNRAAAPGSLEIYSVSWWLVKPLKRVAEHLV